MVTPGLGAGLGIVPAGGAVIEFDHIDDHLVSLRSGDRRGHYGGGGTRCIRICRVCHLGSVSSAPSGTKPADVYSPAARLLSAKTQSRTRSRPWRDSSSMA